MGKKFRKNEKIIPMFDSLFKIKSSLIIIIIVFIHLKKYKWKLRFFSPFKK